MRLAYPRLVTSISGSLLCFVATGIIPVLAQQAATTNTGLEEIVVTARKVEEKLLDTPVSVSVMTAEMLEARGITDMEGISEFTPGLKLDAMTANRNDRSNQSLIIRGMSPTFNGNVSVFIDGAPVVGAGFVSGIDDVARVEVIKGPQSATFGRATFAGAINFVTKDPTDEFHTSIDAQVMSYNGHDLRAFIDGPLVPGKLDFHLEVRDFAIGGDYTDAAEPGYKFGAQSTDSFNLILKAKVTDNLTIKVLGTDWIDDDGVAPNYLVTQFNCAAGAAGATQNYYCGQLPPANLALLAGNEQIDAPIENAIFRGLGGQLYLPDVGPGFSNHMGLERRAYHAQSIIEYDIPAIDASLISNTAGDRQRFEEALDEDMQDTSNLPNPLYSAATATTLQSFINWPFYYDTSFSGYSEDIRLQGGAHGRIHWVVGASYVYQSQSFVTGALLNFGATNFETPTQTISKTTGGYGSIGYDILPNLTATFEGRYQSDHQIANSYAPTSPTTGSFYFAQGEVQNSFIPRAYLQYHPQPNYMVYASFSEGVNPGGFNSNLLVYTPAQQAALASLYGAKLDVEPEKLYSYELGIKGTFLDNHAEVTADVYYANWVNQIVSNDLSISNIAGIPAGHLLELSQNIGKSRLDGFEIEGQYIPVTGLTFNAGFAYTPNKIQQFVCLTCAVSISGNTNVDGNQLPYVPALNFNAGVEYKQPITDSLDGYIRVDGVWQGKIFEDETNLAWIAPTGHANLRLGVIQGKIQVEGWVTNLFDSIGYIQVLQFENLIQNFQNDAGVALPPRRTFGLRLRASLY